MTGASSVRRELSELRTLYRLYPHFRDVVVEGRDDAAWIRWFLSEYELEHVRVFAVDDRVEVPREAVLKFHSEVNARGRVVALASEYDGWGINNPALTCIADSDYDSLENTSQSRSLLKTDYAAMEVYALEERPLSKFLVTSAKSEVSAQDVVSILKPAWTVLYALRYVLHKHSEGTKLTDKFANRCVNSAGEVVADARELLRACNPSPSGDFLARLLELHEECLSQIPDSRLDGIRGHDIAPLIIRFLGLKNALARPDEVERLMRQSIERRDLEQFGLFSCLKSRVAS